MSCCFVLFMVVVDVVSIVLAGERALSNLLYVGNLVLMSEIIKGLANKF